MASGLPLGLGFHRLGCGWFEAELEAEAKLRPW